MATSPSPTGTPVEIHYVDTVRDGVGYVPKLREVRFYGQAPLIPVQLLMRIHQYFDPASLELARDTEHMRFEYHRYMEHCPRNPTFAGGVLS